MLLPSITRSFIALPLFIFIAFQYSIFLVIYQLLKQKGGDFRLGRRLRCRRAFGAATVLPQNRKAILRSRLPLLQKLQNIVRRNSPAAEATKNKRIKKTKTELKNQPGLKNYSPKSFSQAASLTQMQRSFVAVRSSSTGGYEGAILIF